MKNCRQTLAHDLSCINTFLYESCRHLNKTLPALKYQKLQTNSCRLKGLIDCCRKEKGAFEEL